MMYMVHRNRGGAETDGRAEDPFEAAARGASASAPWKFLFFFYLTLYPFLPPPTPLYLPSRASPLLDRASLLRLRNQAQKKSKSALNPCPGATLQHRLNHLLSLLPWNKKFSSTVQERSRKIGLWFIRIRFTFLVTFAPCTGFALIVYNTVVRKEISLESCKQLVM